jgi:lipoate-protein ligase A
MALDSALLRCAQAGVSFLRLYRWDPPCLSFGRNEPALFRYDRDRIREMGLDTVRRPTGGRAVWHDAEVTYAVAAPIEAFGSLAASYHAIHTMIAGALRRLGVPAVLAASPKRGHAGPAAGACFATPAGGEVIVNGRKLAGSAQVREGGAFLQHGSILLDDRQNVVSAVTRGPAPPPSATSLAQCLGRKPSFDEVAAVLAEVVGELWTVREAGPARPDHALIARFSDPGWTWRR